MKILVVCAMLLRGLAAEAPGLIVSMDEWRMDAGRPESSQDRREPLVAFGSSYADERASRPSRPSRLEGLAAEEKRAVVDSAEISLQPRFFARTPCSCESQYEIRDLGDGHYPKYLTAALCKPKACRNKFNACRLLHYTVGNRRELVHVLQQRDSTASSENRYSIDDGVLAETPLPPSLRQNWRLKPVAVPVTCISPLEATARN
ncbi:hypothetical protein KM043_001794 [Ampulex compressa]|nr:hypothetical protein KM043_001794 [Ampulex compressa]